MKTKTEGGRRVEGPGWGAKIKVTSGFVSTSSTNLGMERSLSLRCLERVERSEGVEGLRT